MKADSSAKTMVQRLRRAFFYAGPIPVPPRLHRFGVSLPRLGDVVLETRQVEGQAKPQMVARFTINAVPALAVLDRRASAASNDAPKEMWAAVDDLAQPDEIKRAKAEAKGDTIVSLAYDRKAAARKTAGNRDGAT